METVKGSAEGKVYLRDVSWETYERLMDERGDRPTPRFHYDRGEVEIMHPSKKHEEIAYVAGDLVGLLAMEMELDLFGVGSTTFKSERFGRGFEPDESFYFAENAELVRGRESIELDSGDPPPELVIEVDITRPSLDKLGVYANLGVGEVWRFSAGKVEILVLHDSEYRPAETSTAFPTLSRETLYRLVDLGLVSKRSVWTKEVRRQAARQARSIPKGRTPGKRPVPSSLRCLSCVSSSCALP